MLKNRKIIYEIIALILFPIILHISGYLSGFITIYLYVFIIPVPLLAFLRTFISNSKKWPANLLKWFISNIIYIASLFFWVWIFYRNVGDLGEAALMFIVFPVGWLLMLFLSLIQTIFITIRKKIFCKEEIFPKKEALFIVLFFLALFVITISILFLILEREIIFPNEGTKALRITEKAKKKGAIEVCDKIADDFDKFLCYSEVAVFKNNEKLCEAVPDNNNRKWLCLKEIAVKKESPAICDTISDLQMVDVCYEEIIEKNGNIDLCIHFKGKPLPQLPQICIPYINR